MRARITKRAVAALTVTDDGKQNFIRDTELPGFYVVCYPSGQKSYGVTYHVRGSRKKIVIGNVEEMTPDEARDRARDARKAARDGLDPAARDDRHTVGEMLDRFEAEYLPNRKPKTRESYEALIRLHIRPAIGRLTVEDVKRADIAKMQDAMRSTPTNANRALAVIRRAFNLAEIWGWRDEGTNPTRHVKAFSEQHRQRTLDEPELARLWAVLDDLERDQIVPAAQLFKLLLLTGLRLSEWRDALWSWVDVDRGILSLPDTKTGARVVHLPDAAIDVLSGLPRSSVYILPGETGGPIGGIQKIWRRTRKAAGIDDVRIHDLRHTVGSMADRSGMTQRQIADLLGHRQLSTTARYINSADDWRRETSNAWAAQVERITGKK